MATTTEIDSQAGLATHSLELVNRELSSTLDAARREIEEFVDGQAASPALLRAAELLHLAGGALKIVEIHGAALLADEMEHTCRFLSEGPEEDEARKAVEALTRAMVQLPAYLERLLSGARDVALVLLPLLNDLRAVRGRPLMSEGTLLLLRTGPLERPERKDGARSDTPANAEFRRLAREQRPIFQSRLLGWIRGEQVADNLDDLIQLTSTLEQAANTKNVQQFWGVLCGVCVALRLGALESSVSLKRLVGQADRQLKRLADDGELAFRDDPPLDLLNNLLYYVARADSDDERIRSIRSEFNLNQLIPGDTQLERAREGLAGPSVKLMRTVAEAIKHDLNSVKDSLDIFVRTGMEDLRKLLPQLEMLQKIGDTLGVLGLPSAQEQIRAQMAELNAMVDATSEIDQEILERVAAVLLRVEDDLDRELVRAVVPSGDESEAPESDVQSQYAQVTQAVMGECMVNLAKVKEAVVKLVAEPTDTRALEQVRPQLRGIAAGLLMLNKTTVVRLIERIGAVLLDGLTGEGGVADPQRVERLADAIVSVEYYMETVSAGRKDPWYMLENAARCIELLERTAPSTLSEETVETAMPAIPDALGEETVPQPRTPRIEMPTEPELAEAAELEEPAEAEAAERPAASTGVMAALEIDEDASDPELLEIFIEEARGEIDNIRSRLPAWLDNPADFDALTAARRSFHTLKGSGRTIGALEIGEFAWSVENLLNRLINRTLEPSPVIKEAVRSAADALPALLDHLELGIPPQIDIEGLKRRAEALAAGETDIGEISPEGRAEPAAERPASIDPVLAEIFVKEVRGHLMTIGTFTSKAESLAPPYAVPEAVYRASHTLLGSANMANYAPCIQIAEPLSAFVGRYHQNGIGLTAEGLEVLKDAARAIGEVADALEHDAPPPAAATSVVDALIRLREEAVAAVDLEPELDDEEFAVLEFTDGPSEEMSALELEIEDEPPATEEVAELEEPFLTAPDAPSSTTVPHDRLKAPRTVETADFDPEIAAIFTEEAAEILDETDSVLQSIKGGSDRNEGFGALQRLLHTLKGGARMAGIVAMGDLSHSLETVLTGMAHERLPADAAAIELVQRTLDHLQHLRDCVDHGHSFDYPTALLEELRAFSEGEPRALPVASEVAWPSRDEIIRQTINQPLDFDLTEVGLEQRLAEEALERTDDDGTEETRIQPMPIELLDEHARVADDTLSRTGTVEFSDQQMEGLQRLAFEDHPPDVAPDVAPEAGAGVAPAPRPVEAPPARAPRPSAAEPTAATASREREEITAPVGSGDSARAERADTTRVDAQLLDALLNAAGEISIFQARLNQQLHSVDFHLGELGHTVTRLREQLRKLEAETEAEILHRHQDDSARDLDFDPLELDRYSTIQQLSRALAETANDVASINDLLLGLTNEADTLLTQQGRVTAEIQDGLMQTRMVPFQRHVARFARVVRQAAADTGKSAELVVEGASSELDRQVLDAMLPPLEHLLRNSVTHGIELPERRRALGKPETGAVRLGLRREGAEVVIDVADDGAGLDLEAITRTAIDRGLLRVGQRINEKQAAELILMPGFSTAARVTQSAGRGVGMDVVDNELKKLGGSMTIESRRGEGTHFRIRLPYTLAITHALIVDVGDETFALPLTTVEGITRVRREHLLDLLTQDDPRLQYGDLSYRVQHLGSLVGAAPSALPQDDSAVALVLVRAGDNSTALLSDHLEGSREVVVKGLGPHISSVPGVTGATILGDGRVVIILDPGTLIRQQPSAPVAAPPPRAADQVVTALVVDDSITMRRVTERLLERRGVKVLTARDGLDAISVLQGNDPDIILLDIEMPRMDGYQFAAHVRNDPRHANVPIIMITSRSGEKHRAKAIELGVNDYLSKPYQEQHLIAAIEEQLGRPL